VFTNFTMWSIILLKLLFSTSLVFASLQSTDDLNFNLDGCRYVFLDIGSNIGMHVRFLYEPQLYVRQVYSRLVFDQRFPKLRNRTDVCAVGFEPNAVHIPRLDALHHYYSQWKLNTKWFYAAASNYSGTVHFAHQGDEIENEWGFRKQHSGDFENSTVAVPVMDVVRFITDKVAQRRIPGPRFASDPPPAVIAKLDVEGEERSILPSLFASRAACAVQEMTTEWHYKQELSLLEYVRALPELAFLQATIASSSSSSSSPLPSHQRLLRGNEDTSGSSTGSSTSSSTSRGSSSSRSKGSISGSRSGGSSGSSGSSTTTPSVRAAAGAAGAGAACPFTLVEFDTEAYLHDLGPSSAAALQKDHQAQRPPPLTKGKGAASTRLITSPRRVILLDLQLQR
jgi:uncharacterized membrane protein YgcG